MFDFDPEKNWLTFIAGKFRLHQNVKKVEIKSWWFSVSQIFILLIFLSCSTNRNEDQPEVTNLNVLIFSKTGAFRHESIEPGGTAMKSYFEDHGITSMQTEDSSVFNSNSLAPYDVVMFFQTTGNILDSMQQEALKKYIQSGKGFVGIHSAADTEYDWPWFTGLIGVQFADHPDIQPAVFVKVDTAQITTKHLPDRWTRTDECYNYKQIPSNVTVVLTVDESTYQGGKHGANHPISWYHTYEGGRSFYTAMGHTVENYQDTLFLEHILRGVKWASGK